MLRGTKKNDAEKIMSQNSAPTISQTLNLLYSEGAMFNDIDIKQSLGHCLQSWRHITRK